MDVLSLQESNGGRFARTPWTGLPVSRPLAGSPCSPCSLPTALTHHVLSGDTMSDVCDILIQSLLPPVSARMSKHCEQVRSRVVRSGCAGSLEFTKALAGALVGALKGIKKSGGLECVGTCMRWLRASSEVVRACGSRLLCAEGKGGGDADKTNLQIVQAMIQGQDMVVGAMVRRGRLLGEKRRKVLRCVIMSDVASNKDVMGMYVSHCTRKDASGFGLVGLVWDALVGSQIKGGKEERRGRRSREGLRRRIE